MLAKPCGSLHLQQGHITGRRQQQQQQQGVDGQELFNQ
jgi:hypothetical protein